MQRLEKKHDVTGKQRCIRDCYISKSIGRTKLESVNYISVCCVQYCDGLTDSFKGVFHNELFGAESQLRS